MHTPALMPRRRGRLPKSRDALTDHARALAARRAGNPHRKGFATAGLDEILGRVGVPKGSFYHYFASKEAFGLALIERYAHFLPASWTATYCAPS